MKIKRKYKPRQPKINPKNRLLSRDVPYGFTLGMRDVVPESKSLKDWNKSNQDAAKVYDFDVWDFAIDGCDLNEWEWPYLFIGVTAYGNVMFSGWRELYRKDKPYEEFHFSLDLANLEYKSETRTYLSRCGF